MKFCYYLILILLCTSCVFSKDVTITFIETDGSEKTQIINQDISEFTIWGGQTRVVKGLEKLTKLKTLFIDSGVYLEKELNFLGRLNTVETIVFSRQHIYSTDFLSGWVNLKAIIFQGVNFETDEINISSNSNIEYFEITNSSLDRLPSILSNENIKLLQVNLYHNNLTKEGLKPALNFLNKSKSIILDENPILENGNYNDLKSIEEGAVDDVLLEEYKYFME